ncbi:MAG: SdrD B-like domain-containing protein, partial [Gemmataceae bacterium]
GLWQPLSLGNFVWNDANNNGKFDTAEAGIAGVTVNLLNSTGTVVGTTTTDTAGNYVFNNLTPGTYTFRVTGPTGLVSSTGTPNSVTGPYEPGVSGTQNNEDHGTTAGNFVTSTVTLGNPGDTATNPDNSGFANLRQDFGFTPPPVTTLSLGNFVWNDANNNGVFDAGESPLAGVTLTLTDSRGTTVGTTTTDANGNYNFTGLQAGTYTVTVTTRPQFTTTSTGKNASLTGPYEPGVSGTQNNEDHGTTTGANISATVTLGAFGNTSNPDGSGGANFRQDFGIFTPISFGNTVWFDSNNNGILDNGEQPAPNVPVTLLDGQGTTIATATTDAQGKYQFTNLIPGNYQVRITPPTGTSASTPSFPPLNTTDNQNIGTQSGTNIVTPVFALQVGKAPLISGNTNPNNYVTGDFGVQGLAKVSGFTYMDPNIDGKFTNGVNGDRPIPGTTVTLQGLDANGNVTFTRTTRTDNTGFYQFADLPPGKYRIVETQPGGNIFDGLDTVGSRGGANPSNDVLTVTLAANDNGLNYNFGEIPPAAPFGYVWVDSNRNCQFDMGEPTVAGVPVTISGTAFAGTSLARPLTSADVSSGLTVLTDATGRYEFPLMPPGDYTINRGDLPSAAAAQFVDWCLQNGDPKSPPPAGSGSRQFSAVTLPPSVVRGPFNFGLTSGVLSSVDNDPTKRNFLGSSGNQGGVPLPPPGDVPPPGGPTRADVPFSPSFSTSSGSLDPRLVVAAAGAGYAPQVRVFDYTGGYERFKFYAYEESFTGGVRTATADVTGDGIQDIVTATGIGGGPRIRVFNGSTGALVRDFFAYEDTFRGGVFVAAGDIDGDGIADIITGTETGGGPRVTVFNGVTGAVIDDFFAFDENQRGGVRVAVADFDKDGRDDIVTTTGAGVPTRVRVFSGANRSVLTDYAPYEASFTGGVNLAAGDFNGDGTPDIFVGAEAGGGPRVQIFSGLTTTTLTNFFAYEESFSGGVRVGAKDINGDNRADVVLAAGKGGSSRVRILRAGDLTPIDDFFAFDPSFTGGTYVG